jgi:uncharacterized protein YdiU (UPF0061 family)
MTLPATDRLPFKNSFAMLPPAFYTRLTPTPLPQPYLVAASQTAASLIGLDSAEFEQKQVIDAFAGNQPLPGSLPLAAVYSGHQFGVWAGQLGDGRAILLGEVDSAQGPMELQLKGAGQTPYSRMGDGRAVLRSSIREFLCSQAMAALGIPTSYALAVIGSDLHVMREAPESTAVVTRLAPSFVRFGSFEHWYYQDKQAELKILADYVIAQFYPQLQASDNPYRALLQEVTRRTAHLIAQWQAVGFMHGVMNTDNMSILGLTLDYGPFGFMDAFDPGHICNHTDREGRYAYKMQPQIGHWNCHALAQALLPLIGEVEQAQEALAVYPHEFSARLAALLHGKFGLTTLEAGDDALFDATLTLLQSNRADFTLFFRRLGDLRLEFTSDAEREAQDGALRDLFLDRAAFDAWAVQYRARLRREHSTDSARRLAMHAVNPKYVLRNYLAQQAIAQAQNKDFSEVARLLAVLEHPFDEQPEHEHYAALPPHWAGDLEVSCSS